ncbi:MAG: hypothetical protein ACI9E1_001998 [Cryomorphaceae bacterium]|jgi:uncharacterized protein YijF (DUF1287 family)
MKRFLTLLLLPFLYLLVAHGQQTEEGKALEASSTGAKIVNAAKTQIGKTTSYDPAYQGIPYPMGDIPIEKGVCTDVVIRALRDALNYDLQKQVYLDMSKNFSKYPKIWGLKHTDRNIDHRRVPNLRTFLKRKATSLHVTKTPADYKPGDLVTCMVGKRPHIMIVSDRTSSDGTPLIIHNIGSGAKEEHSLFSYKLTGHYRMKP